MNANHPLILIGLAVSGLFALAFAWLWLHPETMGLALLKKIIRLKFPGVIQLQPLDLAAWLADPQRPTPLLLDVRRPEEYAVSHLPGALLVEPEIDAQTLITQLDSNRPVVVYCSVGYRSSALAQRLRQQGFTHVYNLEGSLFAWANERGPIECDGQPTTNVHPYSLKYRRLLKPPITPTVSPPSPH